MHPTIHNMKKYILVPAFIPCDQVIFLSLSGQFAPVTHNTPVQLNILQV